MKKILKGLLSVTIVVLTMLSGLPLGENSMQPSLLKDFAGGLSLTAYASNRYDHNVSYNPVTNNYDAGDFPDGLNYCYENEIIYFNFSVGTDVYVRKATYHLSRNGQADYLTGTYTPENDYIRYCNFALELFDGSYSIYWDIQYSSPNYSSNVASFTTDSYSFTVYNPEITSSKSTVNLNIDGTKTATIYMTCYGGGDDRYINYTSETSNCVVSHGDWDGDRIPFTITATDVGSSTLSFNLRNSDDVTVATTSVTVNVTENTYTLSYNANGGSGAPSSQSGAKSYEISSKVPTYFGKTFLGWSKSSSATYASYEPTDTISLSGNTPLYAVWKSAESLSLNTNKSVSISFANQEYYYTFRPTSSGTYSFESSGSLDTQAYLYSSSGTELKSDDDGSNEGRNFKLNYDLSSGTTYYLKVRAYSDNTGTSTFFVKKLDTTKPTGSIDSTNNVASSQTVTLNLSDNVGVAGYYWGTSSNYADNTYTLTSSSSTTKTVSSSGTYYLTVKDTSGNISETKSVTFYKTTLNANGGSVSPTSILTASGNTFTFPTPKKSNYIYNGWSTSSSATSGVKTLKPTGNSTYYAVWSSDVIEMIANSSYEAVVSEGGEEVYYTFTPSKTGNYVIYSSGSTDTQVYLYDNSGLVITGDDDGGEGNNFRLQYNLTAGVTYRFGVKYYSASKTGTIPFKFGEVYTVSYNANGGTGSPSSQSKDYGTSLTLSTVVPTKEYTITYNANGGSVSPSSKKVSCTFNGWNTNSSGTGTNYSSGSTYSGNADLPLYAKWSNPTAGTLATPTKDNATFLGWYTSASGGTKVTSSTTITGNTTLYAHWQQNPKSHTVTYNYSYNGGTSATKTTAVVSEGSAIDLTPTAAKSEWTFVGWNTDPNATAGLSSLTMGTSDVTLYAIYKKTLTATFIDYNGTTKREQTSSVTIYNKATSGTVSALTQATYTGWTKRGWSTSTSANASAVSSYSISSNTTFYGLYSRTLTLSYNKNGGNSTPTSQTGTQYANSYSITSTKNPSFTLANAISKSGSIFKGWAKSSVSGDRYNAGANITITSNTTMYAVWESADTTKPTGSISSTNNVASSQTVTLNLSDNVGVVGYYWGTSSNYANNTYTSTSSPSTTQTVSSSGTYYLTVKDTSGNISETKSVTFYKTTLNANGGSVSPTSILTASGNTFTFPTPTKSGCTYNGWSTSSSATSGVKTLKPTGNSTYYAVWNVNNIYNIGEETYSFENFDDNDAGGHCFGMSITSSGYYTGNLDRSIIGLSNNNLYSKGFSETVVKPICYYQHIQGNFTRYALVAGTITYYEDGKTSRQCWDEVLNYVKSHEYDNKGNLQIQIWKNDTSGHAVNFLYYKNENGQDRLYAYDNNFPNAEVYFYLGSDGKIYEAPQSTYNSYTETICLVDMNRYFETAQYYRSNDYVYAKNGEVDIASAKAFPMACSEIMEGMLMYELPENSNKIIITPKVDNATFEYMEQTYSFGEINEDTIGVLTPVTSADGTPTGSLSFTIVDAPTQGKVNSVSIDNVSLNYKASTTITPNINADAGVNYTVSYSSSNPSVATVDENGKVTTKDTGSTTITCTVTDEYGNVVTDTCDVSVQYTWWQWIIVTVFLGWIWY